MSTSINLDGINFGQITLNELIQLTVQSPGTIRVDLGPGVHFKVKGEGRLNRIYFTRDDVALLPRLADAQQALLASVAPDGKKAVHRLRGALTGVLARDPEAKASNTPGGIVWDGPVEADEFYIPDEPVEGVNPKLIIGAVYWSEDGQVMRSDVLAAGILGRKSLYQPEA